MNQAESYELNFSLPQGPTGPQGPEGPIGPAGTNVARSAYLVTFNNGTVTTQGIAVPEDERLPIDREELDISSLIDVDVDDETIAFNMEGYYKVTFTVSAYVPHSTNSTFDPATDFVSLGFRTVGTDDVYIGASGFVPNEVAIELVGQGIIAVNDTNALYELVNLSGRDIYLNTPDLQNISSTSYFSTPLLTIVIEYLGRQGA